MAKEWNSVESPRPLRLMIVEDSQADAELLVSVLKRSGYRVTYDLITTEKHFQQHVSNGYDAIVCDHNLVDWTGMQALAIVRQRARPIPFILVTGTIGEEAVAEYLKQGADDCVLKNHLERFPTVLRRALLERAKAEENTLLHEAILGAKREWELTFDAVTDAVMVLDEAGTIRRANRAAAQLLSLSFADLIGKTHDEVLRLNAEAQAACPFRAMMETGERQQKDAFYPCLHKTFDVVVSPLRDSSGTLRGGTLVMRDISDRLRLDEQLRQSQKMEAVGLLAGGIAHDFINLLNVISGNTEMLGPPQMFTASQQLELEEIRRAIRRATQLTSQLLAFGRRQVLQPKVLDLNLVIAETVDLLKRLIGEDVRVVTELNAQRGVVRADQTQLEQILMNLATNARDAMPDGGELIIRTEDSELGAPEKQKFHYIKPGKFVQLSVIDSGKGIPPDVMQHIFEPFFTTKGKGHGTGLGLAVVYGITKQSGGYIWVTSELNRGARFDIYLPRVNEVPLPTAKSMQSGTQEPRGTETIMVVEDETAVLHVISQFLIHAGYSVLPANTPTRALEIAEAHKQEIPLVIMDAILPEMNGPAIAEKLKSIHPEMVFVFMSGYIDRAVLSPHWENGSGFLQKPITRAMLLAKVNEFLHPPARQQQTAGT